MYNDTKTAKDRLPKKNIIQKIASKMKIKKSSKNRSVDADKNN